MVLAQAAGCRVIAVHVDHGLRPDSAADVDVVAATTDRLGIPLTVERVVVDEGSNLEARARAARRAALGPDAMTGHTADDQAETLLLNLIRGAGLHGLSAMAAGCTKPLLALRRAETHALCVEMGLSVVDDPTNRDPRFRRNRVRGELLPLLDAIAERDVAGVLARATGHLGDDDRFLDELAQALDPTDAKALVAAPVPLARRALRQWLAPDPNYYPPDTATIERVLRVARGEIRGTEVGAGRRVTRSGNRLFQTSR